MTVAVGVIAIATIAAGPSPAGAGGWIVVSLDSIPEVVAGEPVDVGFTVLRHGVTPESSEDLQVVLVDSDGTQATFTAVPTGRPGHHVVTLEVDDAGDYRWSVESPSALTVDLGTIAVAAEPRPGSSWAWDVGPWLAAITALMLAGLAAVEAIAARQRRTDRAPARA
jgi:hypothetical protein